MGDRAVRVLYIDDDAGLSRLVQKHLERRGYKVETAPDGDAGIARIGQGGIDVVALDHYMPGRDGLDTLAEIRRMTDPPPVVYVTGTQEGRIAVAALKAGAVDYVVKDIQGEFLELLQAAVDGAMESVRVRRERDAAEAEVRASRDRFEALATERAVLLNEVNHRVGNSLQLIAALLQLQSNAASAPEIRDALSEARNRVIAVAQVHRRLYASGQVRTVGVDQYLGALVSDIRLAGHADRSSAMISVHSEPIEIEPDRAVALGVVVTELILNAQKYAYPGGSGPVRVHFGCGGGTRCDLVVEDDGVGIDAGQAPRSTGLGRRIVAAMAAKLGGEIAFDPVERGTRVRLSFPLRAESAADAATTPD
jgi:two-component sensor histidine kinase